MVTLTISPVVDQTRPPCYKVE
uniref:Uncharacterized protein n=1 Tax=Arundo donax TaxID=35708 RepID=A0A0A8Y0U3_ARUDO